ncbi:MAG: ATP phosphoribosyltransferase regulatory subunit [Eubacteriales bacterium]|jgi:ATP phosphoribosyltransferase regulatory subunit
MQKWSQYIPEGMNDYLYANLKRKRLIEQAITGVFEERGYLEIETPTLEFLDVFRSLDSHVPDEDMYKLFDAKGRILALRHDMTTPIARVAATKLRQEERPIKLYYRQNVYRNNEYLHGQRDEVTQCGVEVLGLSNDRADMDILITAIEALKQATSQGFKIELGHIGFFKALASQLQAEQSQVEAIRQCIETKNFAQLDSLLDNLQDDPQVIAAIRQLPRLFGEPDILDRAASLTQSEEAQAILAELRHIVEDLTQLGYGEYLAVDLGMVHQIGYYTGLIFRGYLDGSGENCLAGGRYDGLSANFGGELPSTGFAITVNSILDTQEKTDSMAAVSMAPDSVVFYEEGCIGQAYAIYRNIKQMGQSCQISLYATLEEARQHAVNLGAKYLYHVQPGKTEIINL